MGMKPRSSMRRWRWHCVSWSLLAVLLGSASFWLLVPQTSFASVGLQASLPQEDTTLRVAPARVHVWMSERLLPTLSGMVVVNAWNQGVEVGASQVVGLQQREMEVRLPQGLSPGVYVVAWHAASAVDGYLTDGTFQFTVLLPDGRLPSTQGATIPGQEQTFFSQPLAHLDGTTLLIELGMVFWTAAALWRGLLLPEAEDGSEADTTLSLLLQRRFERWWACPTLAVLLLAFLVWMVTSLAEQGRDIVPFSFPIVISLVLGNPFGLLWLGNVLLLLLALRLSLFRLQRPERPPRVTTVLTWMDLFLGLGFFAVVALSSSRDATAAGQTVLPVLLSWLSLLAAAFWVGGILFLACCCLPLLQRQEKEVQARFFFTLFPAFTRWAFVGIVLMGVTSSLRLITSLQSWSDLFTTSSGVVLLSESVLVGVLLRLRRRQMRWFHSQFRQTWIQYGTLKQHLSEHGQAEQPRSDDPLPPDAQQMKSLEILLVRQLQQMRWCIWVEGGIGVSIFICAGLLTILIQSLS